MNKNHLTLCSFGDQNKTSYKMNNVDDFIQWTEENFTYVPYNPRKNINRFGLSITSLDGGVTGIPDLDSLREYNYEHNTSYEEQDFTEFTSVSLHKSLKEILDPIKDNIFRTHILKLGPGGFFPPHRDFRKAEIDSCRLIIPLKNVNPPGVNFVIEDKICHWDKGRVYFVNTAKLHYIFNGTLENSYWIVINCKLDDNLTNLIISSF